MRNVQQVPRVERDVDVVDGIAKSINQSGEPPHRFRCARNEQFSIVKGLLLARIDDLAERVLGIDHQQVGSHGDRVPKSFSMVVPVTVASLTNPIDFRDYRDEILLRANPTFFDGEGYVALVGEPIGEAADLLGLIRGEQKVQVTLVKIELAQR